MIDEWSRAAGITADDAPLFALVTRGPAGTVRAASTTPQSIMRAVKRYGEAIGRPELRPHDLRRTFAHLARAGGAALEQIQLSLGHDKLDTTQKYLGTRLDFQNAPADAIRLTVRP